MKKIKITETQLKKIIENKILSEQFAVPPPSDQQLDTTSMPDEANFSNDADYDPGTLMGNKRPRVYFRNGGSISMQASADHNCVPKDNEGPYQSIELGYPQGGIKMPENINDFLEQGSDSIYNFVPASVVVNLIEMNDGVKSGEVPPFAEAEGDTNDYPIGEEPGDATLRADANPMNAASDNLHEARKRLKEDFMRLL
jgi:hypothetical protein